MGLFRDSGYLFLLLERSCSGVFRLCCWTASSLSIPISYISNGHAGANFDGALILQASLVVSRLGQDEEKAAFSIKFHRYGIEKGRKRKKKAENFCACIPSQLLTPTP